MNILRYRWLFFIISAIVLIPGIISLGIFGLKPGLDFAGGSLLEVKVLQQQPNEDQVKQLQEKLSAIYSIESIVLSGEDQLIIRGAGLNEEAKQTIVDSLIADFGEVQEIRFETIGPTLGKELLFKTITAVGLVALFIIFYVWYEFKNFAFGVCAILAMFHDSFVLLGIFSLLGKFLNVEVDVLFVTAILTTLSLSVHDTIVIFNRIRELQHKHIRQDFTIIANVAILETLARSVNNSLTIILMLLTLVLLGGETIRWFSVALLIGAITGTYSSTFVAVPLLTVWHEKIKPVKNK